MLNFLFSKRLLIGTLLGVVLILLGGVYIFKHIENERILERERNTRLNYEQWHLPKGAKARIGSGEVRSLQYSPNGNQLAIATDIGVWILNPQTTEPQYLLAAHTGSINCISFSPDGKTLAVGTERGAAQLWDTSLGEHLKTFTRQEYQYGIENVFIMPDGHTLAVVSSLNMLLDMWDVATGKRKQTLSDSEDESDENRINYIPDMYMNLRGTPTSFSADGKTIANYDGKETFQFRDIETRKEIQTLKVDPIGQLMTFSPELRSLAITSIGKPIQLWDLNSGMMKHQIETDRMSNMFLTFSQDGNYLASLDDEDIRVWDTPTGVENVRLRARNRNIAMVAFSPDNRTLASMGLDNTLRFWNINTGQEVKTTVGYGRLFEDLVMSADAQTLASSSLGSNKIHLWDANTGKHDKVFIEPKRFVMRTVLNSDGSRLASHSLFGDTLRMWDVNTGKLRILKGGSRHIQGLEFTRDNQTLAYWGVTDDKRNVIHFYDADKGRLQQTLKPNNQLQGLYWIPDAVHLDRMLFVGNRKMVPEMFVWDLVSGDFKITDFKQVRDANIRDVHLAKLSPDGQLLAIIFEKNGSQATNTIELWKIKEGFNKVLTGHKAEVESLAFSPDSRTLASGSGLPEYSIHLWDIETGESKILKDPKLTNDYPRFNGDSVSQFAFSSNGKTLASGMSMGDIHLWDTTTGTIKKSLLGHTELVTHLFFTVDNETLISASVDHTMLIWDVR